jgi:EAL domain-containing protein (putative c-di-GMP-specific phosphodiesterase class I)
MKILIFGELQPFIDEMLETVNSISAEIIIAREWSGCAALLSSHQFDAVITNLRPTGFGGSTDISLLHFINANYPTTNILAILEVKRFQLTENEKQNCSKLATSSGANAIFDNKDNIYKIPAYLKSVLDFKEKSKNKDVNKVETLPTLIDYLKQQAIICHYQPIVCLKTNNIIAYEALARSKSANMFNNPKVLFDYASLSQLFSDVDFACIKAGLMTANLLPKNTKLFLNLQPRSLTNFDFPERLLEIVKYYKLSPENIVLELTEQREILNSKRFYAAIETLKWMGFAIAIDDFGEGNANIDITIMVNPSLVKISGRIIKNCIDLDPVKTIIKGIASLCKESGIKTVAEFIETKEQADLLNELGVDYGQGWFYSKPKPIEDLI